MRQLVRAVRTNDLAPGISLIVATAAALTWANLPWNDSYNQFWRTSVGVHLGDFQFERSLAWFVNDCLMVIFFFVVGIEIREEIHDGELAHWRRAALPTLAAVGGMVVPALAYVVLARAPKTGSGWGIPMATDIAFAVGILTLLGSRVPPALRIVLLALAVIDDLGAILVIAVFYSSGINSGGLVVAAFGLLSVVVLKRLGIRAKWAYLPPAFAAWAGTYAAGIHPTIAGVALGLLTPVVPFAGNEITTPISEGRNAIRVDDFHSPGQYWLTHLQPWVSFAIMPIFALANAGVHLNSLRLDASSLDIMLGIGVGLVIGKPVGILVFTWTSLKTGLAVLPPALSARHLWILGCTAGIGFTMSLFIAQLAFTQPEQLDAARLEVVVASAIAGLLVVILGRVVLRRDGKAQ